jgi:O-antigen/teichoic acid export membrane protein
MYWAVAGHVSGRIVTLVATVAAIAAGFGFEAIVWAYVAGLAVAFAVHAVAVARVVSVRPVIDTRYWRNLFVGSLALGFAIAISQIYFRVDALLLAALRSSEEVGFYGAAYKFVELGQFFSATVAISMFPPLANFVAGNDRRAAKVLIQKAFDVLLAGGVFTGLVMLAFPEEIITLAAGEEFREAAPALQLLAPWTLFGFTLAVLWRVLLASGRDAALLATAVAALVLNVALNLALIPVYGFKAAAVVSVLTEALILAPIALLVSRDGLLPGLRYLPTVAGAGAVLAAILWLLPGPAPLVGVVGSAVYAAILFAVPGAVQEAATSLLVRRPRLLRSRP